LGFLNQMQAEIDSQATARTVHILGVNGVGLESGNESLDAAIVLPWLQPTAGADVWTQWRVEYRDVVVLGPDNERLGAFNLTVHDLSDPANYVELEQLLLDAAAE
jgi:hypothetical protein